jgi:hypothetical protein
MLRPTTFFPPTAIFLRTAETQAYLRSTVPRIVLAALLLSLTACVLSLLAYTAEDAIEEAVALDKTSATNEHKILIATTTVTNNRFGAIMAAGVNLVAAFHYSKIVDLRGNAEKVTAQVEDACDSVRLSDWLVTLPALAVELHILLNTELEDVSHAIENGWLSGLYLVLMVGCGFLQRFIFEKEGGGIPVELFEKSYTTTSEKNGILWWHAVVGLTPIFVGSVLLILALVELYDRKDTKNDWIILQFATVPWPIYGVVAAVSTLTLSLPTGPKSNTIVAVSIGKDIFYGMLDVWSKAVLGLWVASKVAGVL